MNKSSKRKYLMPCIARPSFPPNKPLKQRITNTNMNRNLIAALVARPLVALLTLMLLVVAGAAEEFEVEDTLTLVAVDAVEEV